MTRIFLAGLLAISPLLAQGGRAARPKVQRPDGPVWLVIRENCTACHGIDDYAFFALDRPAWQKLIADKHGAGDFALSDADRSLLLDWLVAKFGPGSKPFPRTYIPKAITTFFSDPEAYRILNQACTRCHQLDRVQSARKAEEE
jgi:mono/diheme cytochrome c family protein